VRFRAELVNAVLQAASRFGQAQQRPVGLRIGHIGDDYAAFTLVREDPVAPQTRNYLVRVPPAAVETGSMGRFDETGQQAAFDDQGRAFAALFGQGLSAALAALRVAPGVPGANASRLH
jgi:hypothetical protein